MTAMKSTDLFQLDVFANKNHEINAIYYYLIVLQASAWLFWTVRSFNV